MVRSPRNGGDGMLFLASPGVTTSFVLIRIVVLAVHTDLAKRWISPSSSLASPMAPLCADVLVPLFATCFRPVHVSFVGTIDRIACLANERVYRVPARR